MAVLQIPEPSSERNYRVAQTIGARTFMGDVHRGRVPDGTKPILAFFDQRNETYLRNQSLDFVGQEGDLLTVNVVAIGEEVIKRMFDRQRRGVVARRGRLTDRGILIVSSGDEIYNYDLSEPADIRDNTPKVRNLQHGRLSL
jgi:hypothetical protein